MIQSDAERQAPITLEDAEPSHLARYQFAQSYLTPTDIVLDAPCGSGYGTCLLSKSTAHTTGVDINAGAINHAKEFFGSKKNTFIVGDIEDMHKILPDNHVFDAIISFEGIEHIAKATAFLSEVHRLLNTNGTFIISTPRKPHGSPFHIIEYSLEEFTTLLSKHFEITHMFGQIFTDIFDLETRELDYHAYHRFNFIAICTPRKTIG